VGEGCRIWSGIGSAPRLSPALRATLRTGSLSHHGEKAGEKAHHLPILGPSIVLEILTAQPPAARFWIPDFRFRTIPLTRPLSTVTLSPKRGEGSDVEV